MKKIFGATDTGLVRKTNQDIFFIEAISDDISFAVLCDGMGGENGGNIASSIAAEHACSALRRGLSDGFDELSLHSLLSSAIAGANALVYDAATKDQKLAGMGTTMIITVFMRETLYIACVGDSRVYCVSPERELQITRDHTVVQMLVDIGEITSEDARTHPKRHFITRAVGVGADVKPDFIVHELEPDDLVLICSDGLYNYLEAGTIYGILERCMQDSAAAPLIDFARDCGGSDNITAVVYGS